MAEIIRQLKDDLQHQNQTTFKILDPDLFHGQYAGSVVETGEEKYLYRSLRAWMELAELLECRMCVPKPADYPLLELCFEKRGSDSFHTDDLAGTEKYGSSSLFSSIHKMEEPAFYHYFEEALRNARLQDRHRILDLGINRGDEFDVIRKLTKVQIYRQMKLVGIDHAESALTEARTLFPEENVSFHAADINQLDTLDLGRFDLLISIGTLQSPSINYKPMLMHLVQHYMNREDSAIILGFPNSRWENGEVIYGARTPHYNFSEMGVVLEDILFAKRYLQQKKYRVMITGKHYLFLTAVRIGKKA
jgi:hypothetical protein